MRKIRAVLSQRISTEQATRIGTRYHTCAVTRVSPHLAYGVGIGTIVQQQRRNPRVTRLSSFVQRRTTILRDGGG